MMAPFYLVPNPRNTHLAGQDVYHFQAHLTILFEDSMPPDAMSVNEPLWPRSVPGQAPP